MSNEEEQQQEAEEQQSEGFLPELQMSTVRELQKKNLTPTDINNTVDWIIRGKHLQVFTQLMPILVTSCKSPGQLHSSLFNLPSVQTELKKDDSIIKSHLMDLVKTRMEALYQSPADVDAMVDWVIQSRFVQLLVLIMPNLLLYCKSTEQSHGTLLSLPSLQAELKKDDSIFHAQLLSLVQARMEGIAQNPLEVAKMMDYIIRGQHVHVLNVLTQSFLDYCKLSQRSHSSFFTLPSFQDEMKKQSSPLSMRSWQVLCRHELICRLVTLLCRLSLGQYH